MRNRCKWLRAVATGWRIETAIALFIRENPFSGGTILVSGVSREIARAEDPLFHPAR